MLSVGRYVKVIVNGNEEGVGREYILEESKEF